jgi:beta-lactamase class A
VLKYKGFKAFFSQKNQNKPNMGSNPRRPSVHYYQPHRQTPNRKRGASRRFLRYAALILVLFFGYHFVRSVGLPYASQKIGSSVKAAVSPPKPVLTPAAAAQMASRINSVIQTYPDVEVGVAIQDLNNGTTYHYGVSNPFVAASVSKVLTAALFLHQVETGQQTLDEQLDGGSAQYELQQMIEQSDNDAWQSLNDLLTHDALQSYAAHVGLSNYDPDQNSLTVDDISLLLGKIYKGQLLNPAHTQQLLNYMKDANFDSYIPASVPSGVKVYHKAGWLDDRVHDAAIIDNGKHPYVLVIFTKDDSGVYDSDEGHQIFSSITTATVKAFINED